MAASKVDSDRIRIRDCAGIYRAIPVDALLVGAKQAVSARFKVGFAIRSPSDTEDYLQIALAGLEHELFCCVYLDNRHRVVGFEELFRGTVDGTSVYPREVVKQALAFNAAALICAHNHPSGVSEPSQADERITRRLKSALELVDVRLLDHLVIGSEVTSMAARGLL